jgi:hypothetical protein
MFREMSGGELTISSSCHHCWFVLYGPSNIANGNMAPAFHVKKGEEGCSPGLMTVTTTCVVTV